MSIDKLSSGDIAELERVDRVRRREQLDAFVKMLVNAKRASDLVEPHGPNGIRFTAEGRAEYRELQEVCGSMAAPHSPPLDASADIV